MSISELHPASASGATPAKATRTPASGPCACARRTCWHVRQCRGTGVVRVLRAVNSNGSTSSSVVLCRECAASTQRNHVA